MTPGQGETRKRGRPKGGQAPDPLRIEHVALQSFAMTGYGATSIRAVAARAKVDPAVISRRYGSKLGLWLATVDTVAARLNELYDVMRDEMAGAGPFEVRFRNALRHFVAFNCETPELPHFFLNELQLAGGRRDYVTTAIWRPYLTVMQSLFNEARACGLCPLTDPALAPASFLGLVVMPHLVAPALEADLRHEPPSLVDRIMSSVDALFMLPGGEVLKSPSGRDS
jgi:TetR/AcrR family transcriptional regulator